MPNHKLTDRWIDRGAPTPPKGERVEYFDTLLPSFGVRISDSGRRTFVVHYRRKGSATKRRMTIGPYPAWTLSKAREEAQNALRLAARGEDPMQVRDKASREDERRLSNTFRSVSEDFLEIYAKKRRSYSEKKRNLDVYVTPRWKTRPIGEITRRDVAELLDRIERDNGPVMADRVLAEVRKLFNWHATRDDDFVSPIVRGMSRTIPKERERTRTLRDDEIRMLWPALDNTAPKKYGDILRLCLLLGQRRSEISGMRDSEISGDVWTIPADRCKSKRDQVVPLTKEAKAIIARQPRLEKCDYVFAIVRKTPFSGWSKAKADLDSRCAIAPWVVHDLRRTARSLMSRAGVQNDTAERVLGHAITGVRGVYDRHEYLSEKRLALEALATMIDLILNPVDNVVPLRG